MVSIMRKEEQVVAVWRVVWRDGVEWGAKKMQLSIKTPNRKYVPDSARLRRNPADLSEMAPAYQIQEPQKLNRLSTVDDEESILMTI